MHESLNMNARKSGERTKVWTWTHENSCVHVQTKKLTFYAYERTLANARKSGHRQLPSGTVWTYLLPSGTSAWDAFNSFWLEKVDRVSILIKLSVFHDLFVNFWRVTSGSYFLSCCIPGGPLPTMTSYWSIFSTLTCGPLWKWQLKFSGHFAL